MTASLHVSILAEPLSGQSTTPAEFDADPGRDPALSDYWD